MGIKFRTEVTISDSFRDILKRQQYEELVLATLNRSKSLIKNRPLKMVMEQSNNEPDFLDSVGNKYDVKLILDTEQGALIGERKNDLWQWIRSMMDECEEFNDCIKSRCVANVKNTRLYDILKKRISSVKTDEVAILLCPYPVVSDSKETVFIQFATDFLQAVADELSKEISACRGVYFLYPSMEMGIMVLRDAKTRVREYINAPEISKYISFVTKTIVE